MGIRQQPLDARTERRAIVALLAVFALLVQAVIPSLALAASRGQGAEIICSSTGLHPGHAGETAPQNHGADGCDHCVCPVAMGTTPPTSDLDSATVQYAKRTDHAGFNVETCAPGRGLAAPPPPSRGPPSLTA